MKIGSTFYNEDGELMAPTDMQVRLNQVIPGGMPTTEAGFYHRFKFEGRTKREREDKAARFARLMSEVPGYMLLVPRSYTVEMGAYVRYGLDVIYVVESARQRELAERGARHGLSAAR